MKKVTAKLVGENEYQRFYKLSKGIKKGKYRDVEDELNDARKRLKPEYKHLITENKKEWDLICISDAHTHVERLAFLGVKYGEIYDRLNSLQLVGNTTFMIDGGDENSIEPDENYLKKLIELNNMNFEGIIGD